MHFERRPTVLLGSVASIVGRVDSCRGACAGLGSKTFNSSSGAQHVSRPNRLSRPGQLAFATARSTVDRRPKAAAASARRKSAWAPGEFRTF
jgi:hypothetical protein